MIAILDYDMGNVGSIKNMFHHIGINNAVITRDEAVINQSTHIILPGVGAFDAGMKNLEKYGLIDIIYKNVVNEKKYLLGICLGMQLLGRKSDEGEKTGLNLIEFDTVRFNISKMRDISLKIPHMGWDYVDIMRQDCKIVKEMNTSLQRFYFVHTYHALCDSSDNVLMECDYGYKFAAAVIKDNIIGVQFHPEKSHKFGMNLLKSFAEL